MKRHSKIQERLFVDIHEGDCPVFFDRVKKVILKEPEYKLIPKFGNPIYCDLFVICELEEEGIIKVVFEIKTENCEEDFYDAIRQIERYRSCFPEKEEIYFILFCDFKLNETQKEILKIKKIHPMCPK